ncbi:VCBS repeat-containing protein [Spirosoma arcticum]
MSARVLFVFALVSTLSACKTDRAADALFTTIRSTESGVTFNNAMQPFENDTLNANTYDPMYNGAGVGVGDFNRDGQQDLFFAGNNVTCRLYLNRGNFSFDDVTAKAGVTTRAWCTGVSVADVNQDGWPDIYVSVAGRDTNRAVRHNLLFINTSRKIGAVPTFRELGHEYGLDDSGMNTQAAFFDYDRDGDLDCYILNNAMERTGRNTIRPKRINGEGLSTDRLYRNMTTERANRTAEAELKSERAADESNSYSRSFTPLRRSDSLFKNVSREAGILKEGYGLGLTIADINQDGWPDVYCANDFLSNDVVYVNNGGNDSRAGFTDRAAAYFKHTSYNSMGVDIQDVNNDSRPDVMVVDMLPETNARQKMMLIKTNWEFFHLARQQGYQDEYVRNTLQLNMGENSFSEVGQLAGVFRTDWSWAPLLADLDNDGWKDLFITNGYRRDITNLDYVAYLNSSASSFGRSGDRDFGRKSLAELYKLPDVKLHNYVYRNTGGDVQSSDSGQVGATLPTFADKSETWGFGEPTFSNGAAYADLDNDGDLDLVINNMDDEAGLYRNETNWPGKPVDKHWLRLHLPADARGLGAEVRVRTADGMTQTVAAHPVRGYASSVEPFVHVGLGKHTDATVEVRWADGTYQAVGKLTVDRLHEISYKPTATSPPVPPTAPKLFITADATTIGLTFRHQESPLNDFERTPLLPQVYAKNSPAIAIADADGNGLDDVFVGADPGQTRSLFLQTSPGRFQERVQGANDLEDMGSLFFDADGDGDPDLYVVSGGSRLPDSSGIYQDRLYLNDGTGKLTRTQNVLPPTTSSGSCVVAADFDGDGDLDLFRAGRVNVGRYPMAPRCYLLRNDRGKFTDVTDQLAPGLRHAGMVCAALWTDYDNDNDPDLLLAGEFMPITLLKNTAGKFTIESLKTGTDQPLSGWWNSLTGADFDLDGDIDYLAGNLGLNTRYRVSEKEPLQVYAKDFDGNGQIDPILTQYLQGGQHIVPIRDVLNDQMPTFSRKRFTNFQAYADKSLNDAFTSDDLDGATVLRANELRSCYLENKGGGRFAMHPLPGLAQVAPVFGMQTGDFNGDGLPDALLTGNSYASETYSGWHDAGRGCVLLGDGRGHFRAVAPEMTGLHADGDAKALAALSTGNEIVYLLSNNNGPVQLLKPQKSIKPQPAKPGEVFRLVKHKDGRTQRVEFYYGSGYLSQSSR